MLAVHGIACDDTINKYNERIPLSTMIDMYKKQWSDRFPFSVNHDHTKTIGYSRIDGVYFDPSRAVVVTSSYIPENEEELKQMKALLSVKPKNEEQYKSLHAELSNYIIGNVTYYSIDSVSLRNEGIVYRVFPEIKAQIDDDGLIDISFLDTVSPGIYKVGKYLIYGHRYFRRNLSLLNTLNDPFFSDLEQYKLLHPEASVKIRIDPDLIGLAGTESKRREYAYWWGPLFSEDLSAIPLGLSHFENDQYDALTSPIRFTECGWYIQDGRKTFECEEVCDSENIVLPEEVLSGCRYVHSMMDSNSTIVHFDGAIRGYSMEKMLDRLSQRMTEVKKDTVYTKLWRIDGDVPVLIWKKLITQYYRDNHMIGEYLGGKEKQQPPEIIEKKQEDTTAKLSTEHYIPVDLSMDDGIRVFFSMRKPISIGDSNVAILPILNKADNGLPDIYIESFARTFGKMLSRKGLIARMPISPELLFYNDMNINLPYLICDTRKTMGLVLECINEFCKAWEKDKQDRQLSFTIGLNDSVSCSLFSFVGHISAFCIAFKSNNLSISTDSINFEHWMNALYSYISKAFKPNERMRYYDQLLGAGRIGIPRVKVDYDIQLIRDKNGYSTNVNVPSEELTHLIENHISLTPCLQVRKERCTKCGHDYSDCSCVKYIDKGCTTTIEEAVPQGYFWITHSADIV